MAAQHREHMRKHMGGFRNRGTPKSSILVGFSIINHFGVSSLMEIFQCFEMLFPKGRRQTQTFHRVREIFQLWQHSYDWKMHEMPIIESSKKATLFCRKYTESCSMNCLAFWEESCISGQSSGIVGLRHVPRAGFLWGGGCRSISSP